MSHRSVRRAVCYPDERPAVPVKWKHQPVTSVRGFSSSLLLRVLEVYAYVAF